MADVGLDGGTRPPPRGWRVKKSGDRAVGRSRGGFSTEVHVATDALGNPIRVRLTAGQAADIKQAEALLGDRRPDAMVADMACDSDALVQAVAARGAAVVIPPKKNRTVQ